MAFLEAVIHWEKPSISNALKAERVRLPEMESLLIVRRFSVTLTETHQEWERLFMLTYEVIEDD